MEGAANRLLRALAQQFCWQTQFCRCCNRRCRGDGALEKCPCLLELTPPKFCSLQPLLFWSSASHTCSDRAVPNHYGFRNSSGSLAIFAAILRVSSLLINFGCQATTKGT